MYPTNHKYICTPHPVLRIGSRYSFGRANPVVSADSSLHQADFTATAWLPVATVDFKPGRTSHLLGTSISRSLLVTLARADFTVPASLPLAGATPAQPSGLLSRSIISAIEIDRPCGSIIHEDGWRYSRSGGRRATRLAHPSTRARAKRAQRRCLSLGQWRKLDTLEFSPFV